MKVRGCSRKSQAVHFNNFQLYKGRQEGSMEESGDREAVEAHKGGNGYVIKMVKMTSETVYSILWDITQKTKRKC